jgi:hypothetical protein
VQPTALNHRAGVPSHAAHSRCYQPRRGASTCPSPLRGRIRPSASRYARSARQNAPTAPQYGPSAAQNAPVAPFFHSAEILYGPSGTRTGPFAPSHAPAPSLFAPAASRNGSSDPSNASPDSRNGSSASKTAASASLYGPEASKSGPPASMNAPGVQGLHREVRCPHRQSIIGAAHGVCLPNDSPPRTYTKGFSNLRMASRCAKCRSRRKACPGQFERTPPPFGPAECPLTVRAAPCS